MRVAATGGVPRAVPYGGKGAPRLPEFLPDGRHFLFFLRLTPDRDGVYLGALDSPEVRRILAIDNVAAYAPPGYLLFVRQGVLMAVSFDASSGTVSGEPVPVATPVNRFPVAAVRFQSRRMVCSRTGRAQRADASSRGSTAGARSWAQWGRPTKTRSPALSSRPMAGVSPSLE